MAGDWGEGKGSAPSWRNFLTSSPPGLTRWSMRLIGYPRHCKSQWIAGSGPGNDEGGPGGDEYGARGRGSLDRIWKSEC